ncbi:MAG TPA: helix-turn-helix transcriptional regulator [Candidatus Dormibacteraeota bacterium]|nr:helix-turn-helix transcriptional regulator [Candidatus Dormibacteraeota bacterium]
MARARRRAGLTQVELAKRLGTTQAAVTRLETGRFLPAVRTLCRLARALDVGVEIGPGV